MKELRVRVQHRQHNAEVWTTINPILEPGEIGIETDTRKFKYGDGVSNWCDLQYSYGSGLQCKTFEVLVGEEEQGRTYLEDEVFDPEVYKAQDHPGEIAIVPRVYTEIEEKDIEGTITEITTTYRMDTPYISLRKNGTWYWTIFADQKNKPLTSSQLDFFQLDISTLG